MLDTIIETPDRLLVSLVNQVQEYREKVEKLADQIKKLRKAMAEQSLEIQRLQDKLEI